MAPAAAMWEDLKALLLNTWFIILVGYVVQAYTARRNTLHERELRHLQEQLRVYVGPALLHLARSGAACRVGFALSSSLQHRVAPQLERAAADVRVRLAVVEAENVLAPVHTRHMTTFAALESRPSLHR